MDKSPLVRRLERRNFWILGAMLAMSPLLSKPGFTAGLAAGGGISILGFYSLQGLIRRTLTLPAHKARLKVVAYHYIRLTLLFGILALIFSQRILDPVGMLVGLSVVVFNLLFTAAVDLRKIRLEV